MQRLRRVLLAVGVAGLFVECHEDPDHAPSDGPNMVPLAEMRALLERLQAFDRLAKQAQWSEPNAGYASV